MGYLIGSILCATGIFIIFKAFDSFKVNTRNAIISNYLTAALLGVYLAPEPLVVGNLTKFTWLGQAFALGVLFVLVFNLMALTAQKNGVSSASVATKMSLIIPVVLSVWLHGEHLNLIKILGVLIALAAVFLATQNPKKQGDKIQNLTLPMLVFFGSGVIDASLKFLSETRVPKNEFPLFSAGIFGSAALSGLIFVGLKFQKNNRQVHLRDLAGGIVLGIPNFFSVYFLMQALQYQNLSSVTVFTLNNVGVVLLTTLMGLLLFQERLSARNSLGIVLAVLSILLVALF
ncbi:MAG: hypothetical protein RLZZ241_2443 [Bacteroidota bacterium]|jgi:drug/metabolite transporter (DMT)-like permease